MDNSVLKFISEPVNFSSLIAASVLLLIAAILILFRGSFYSAEQPVSKNKDKKGGQTARSIIAEVLSENEVASNLFFAKVLLAASGIFIFIAVAAETELITVSADKTLFGLMLACLISATASAALITIGNDGRSRYSKRLLLSAFIMDMFLMCILFPDSRGLLLLFPAMISIRYGDGKFTAGTTVLCAVANVISRPAAVAFGIYTGDYTLQSFSVPRGTDIEFASSITETLMKNGILTTRSVLRQELSTCLLSVLTILFAGFCMTMISLHVRRMLIEGAELSEKKKAAEMETEAAKSKIMMSQLQPHFLYNSLSAIMAIDGNPPETIDALADFSRYLRGNLDSLTCSDLVPFAAETEHIERYLALEKLRFGDRLNILYDIKVKDFRIPPLSVQMAVENAVKHGITQKPEGGTLRLSTEEKDGVILITIEDDGVGFDTSRDFAEEGNHVGLTSGVRRIKELTGGTTEITSKPGEGTKVEIRLPRENTV